jgi:hypothetical protein
MGFSARAGVTQLVECDLAKVDVAGSNPVSRSITVVLPLAMMKRLVFLSCLVSIAAIPVFAQDYRVEAITAPAPDLPAAYASVIQSQGYRVIGPKGPWVEIWFAKSIPTGAKPSDDSIVLPIAQGTLLGVFRFPGTGYDRRGQTIKAGVYTMRYSNYPVNGAHQGVAPQRDFALLTPIAGDADPSATPAFDALVEMSTKASGTPHPAVVSLETPSSAASFPSVTTEGDNGDRVLNVKAGSLPLAIIVAGKVQA